MKKSTRTELARQAVAICESGSYQLNNGRGIELAPAIAAARDGTRLHTLDDFPDTKPTDLQTETEIEVTSESTMEALSRLTLGSERHVAGLNFASAKNPGGGFLSGAQAQEETLARSSALYPCLLTQPAYYERNRANRSLLYLDLVIFSPNVPFFRDDSGTLLEKPYKASIVTAPAPNAGAVAINEPANLPLIPETLRRRARFVLAIAHHYGATDLVLGAWGCGVFRNDPKLVATTFAGLVQGDGPFTKCFTRIVFAIYDRSSDKSVLHAFEEILNG